MPHRVSLGIGGGCLEGEVHHHICILGGLCWGQCGAWSGVGMLGGSAGGTIGTLPELHSWARTPISSS